MDLIVVQKLAIALGLGLLVGFQREWTAPHVAGLRTFALITAFGTVLGILVETLGGWLVGAGLIAVAAMIIAVRHAQDYRSTLRAVGVCVIGWIVQNVAMLLLVPFIKS